MSSADEGSSQGGGVSNQLALLVPSFDPAVDNVDIWSSKVSLLVEAWPETKMTELATRLILNTKGSAFQKLHLQQKDILVNDKKSIKKIVEIVGGTWGQIPLEHRFELVEKALFRCQQKSDETGDSYIARVDVIWTELLAKAMDLSQVQAYVLLRGSRLTPEDKKRVPVESGAESEGKALEWKRVVAAIRMLGSAFFQDYTGNKRDKTQKTYDHLAFGVEDDDEPEEQDTYWVTDENLDDETVAYLASEQDEDAALILQFEEAITEAVQNDSDLAAFFATYQDARRRLTERVKFRGFWPVKKGGSKGFGKKGGKTGGKGKMSLAQRIANSHCRLCGKKGHWKAECSKRAGANMGGSPTASSTGVPTSFVVSDQVLPELIDVPEIVLNESLPDACVPIFGVVTNNGVRGPVGRWVMGNFVKRLQHTLRSKMPDVPRDAHNPELKSARCDNFPCPKPYCQHVTAEHVQVEQSHEINFASSGTIGVVDLGASQTVMGSGQVAELLKGLPDSIRAQVRRTPCHLVFRFGNHQTLTSEQALLLPLKGQWFRIAVVPGQTPFLLSSTFLKQIKAVIDTDVGTMWSKELQKSLEISKSPKNLYLMDINQLWDSTADAECSAQTFASDIMSKNSVVSEKPCSLVSGKPKVEAGSLGQRTPELKQLLEPHEKSTAPQSAVERPESSKPNCVSPPSTTHSNVFASSTVQGVPEERSTADTTGSPRCCQNHDTAGSGGREDSLRGFQEGFDFQAGIRGCLMDRVHPVALREERKDRSHDVHTVCQASHGGRHKDQNLQGDEGHTNDQDGPSCSQRCVGRTADFGDRHHDPSSFAAGRRDDQSPSGESKPCSPHGADRDGDAGGARAFAQDECQDGGLEQLSAQEAQNLHCRAYAESNQLNAHVDVDFEFQAENPNNSFSKTCKRLIHQYQQELRQVQDQLNHHRMRAPKLDVLEVMCSDHSELAKQADSLGGRGRRFGLSQGDLQTVAGRKKLFEILIMGDPEHLWYSPECGPWSMWSNFNMGRSMDGFYDVLEKQRQSLWQLSLAVVLFRFQASRSKHFHLEQPDGSKMLIQECLREIRENTEVCRFDLCRVGSLCDPISAMPIRKRLSVCTTSQAVHRAIHGKWCNQNHEHKQIAGSTKVGNQRMPLSSFTEHYPRKFARQLAKIMLYDKGQEVPIYAVRSGGAPNDVESHPTKKRRLGQKLSPEEIARRFARVNWQTAMDMANQMAPRVGPLVIESGPLIQVVQKLCPDHTVVHVVLCRGTDRYMGPTKAMTPGSAPLRRRICIRRRHEDLAVDSE